MSWRNSGEEIEMTEHSIRRYKNKDECCIYPKYGISFLNLKENFTKSISATI